jgi:hypothetical protein
LFTKLLSEERRNFLIDRFMYYSGSRTGEGRMSDSPKERLVGPPTPSRGSNRVSA